MSSALVLARFAPVAARPAHNQAWLASNDRALLVGAGIVLVLLLILLGLGTVGDPKARKLKLGIRALIGGADNRLSTSKAIVVAWTVVVAWMLIAEALRDFAANIPLGNLPVSNDYLLLLGGPFAAAVLAKQIVVTRLTNGTLSKPSAPPGAPIKLSDLIAADDGQVDLVDFQYSLFNLIALGIVVYTFVEHPALGLPPVPSGLLAVTSAAAATYVGNKAVTSSAPSIAQFTPGQVRLGQVTAITGSNLMASAANADFPVVTIGGVPAPVLGKPSASSVTVRVPMGVATVPGGHVTPVTLVTDPTGAASAASDVMVVPDSVQITDITPSAPPPGVTVVLHGAGFLDASAMAPADRSVPFDIPVVVIQTADSGNVLARIPVPQNAVVNQATAPPSDSQLTIEMPQLSVRALTPLRVSVTRGALTSAPVPIVLGSGPVAPVPPSDLASVRVVDVGNEDLTYGVGVCTLTGKVLGSALAFQAPTDAAAFTGTTTITLCQTRDEVYKALNITVDTEASFGMGSVSDKFTWAQSQDTVSTSLHLVVRAALVSDTLELTGPALRADALSLLQTTPADFVTFFQRYGDRFVSGRVMGGEYLALLSIQTRYEADLLTVSDALKASVSAGDLDASVAVSVTQTLNQYHDEITISYSEWDQGGDSTKAAAAATAGNGAGGGGGTLSPETVMRKAIAFPATVTTANAYPLRAVLSDYSQLALPDSQAWLTFEAAQILPAREFLLGMEALIQGMQSDLDQVTYILANPELFVWPPPGSAEPQPALQQYFGPLAASLPGQISQATTLAGNYAGTVMARGQASAVLAPAIPPRAPITWPASKPVPTYRILLADPSDGSTEWAVSCPTGGDHTGPLVLQPGNPSDLGQQFQIPQVAEVSFTMTNVRTGLMVTWTGTGQPATQSPGSGSNVLWGIANSPAATAGTSPVLLQPLAENASSREFLGLRSDRQQAGDPIVTWMLVLDGSHDFASWRLEDVTAPPAAVPQFGVTIAVPSAW